MGAWLLSGLRHASSICSHCGQLRLSQWHRNSPERDYLHVPVIGDLLWWAEGGSCLPTFGPYCPFQLPPSIQPFVLGQHS